RSASRTVVRDAPKLRAISRSAGSLSPYSYTASAIALRKWAAMPAEPVAGGSDTFAAGARRLPGFGSWARGAVPILVRIRRRCEIGLKAIEVGDSLPTSSARARPPSVAATLAPHRIDRG